MSTPIGLEMVMIHSDKRIERIVTPPSHLITKEIPKSHHMVPEWFLKNWSSGGMIVKAGLKRDEEFASELRKYPRKEFSEFNGFIVEHFKEVSLKKTLSGPSHAYSYWSQEKLIEFETTIMSLVEKDSQRIFNSILDGSAEKIDVFRIIFSFFIRSRFFCDLFYMDNIQKLLTYSDEIADDIIRKDLMSGRVASIITLASMFGKEREVFESLEIDYNEKISYENYPGGFWKNLNRYEFFSVVELETSVLCTSDNPFGMAAIALSLKNDIANKDMNYMLFNLTPKKCLIISKTEKEIERVIGISKSFIDIFSSMANTMSCFAGKNVYVEKKSVFNCRFNLVFSLGLGFRFPASIKISRDHLNIPRNRITQEMWSMIYGKGAHDHQGAVVGLFLPCIHW